MVAVAMTRSLPFHTIILWLLVSITMWVTGAQESSFGARAAPLSEETWNASSAAVAANPIPTPTPILPADVHENNDTDAMSTSTILAMLDAMDADMNEQVLINETTTNTNVSFIFAPTTEAADEEGDATIVAEVDAGRTFHPMSFAIKAAAAAGGVQYAAQAAQQYAALRHEASSTNITEEAASATKTTTTTTTTTTETFNNTTVFASASATSPSSTPWSSSNRLLRLALAGGFGGLVGAGAAFASMALVIRLYTTASSFPSSDVDSDNNDGDNSLSATPRSKKGRVRIADSEDALTLLDLSSKDARSTHKKGPVVVEDVKHKACMDAIGKWRDYETPEMETIHLLETWRSKLDDADLVSTYLCDDDDVVVCDLRKYLV